MSKTDAPVENHCPACLQGQSLEAGEGTHREGTVEHPVEGTAVDSTQEWVDLRPQAVFKLQCDYRAEKARTRELEKRLADAEGYLSIACADMARAGIQPYLRKNIAAFLSQGSGE